MKFRRTIYLYKRTAQQYIGNDLVCFIVLILLCSFSKTGYAQIDSTLFEKITHYTVDAGMPADYVSDFIEDKNGFLWLATSDGVSVFDGTNFTNFHDYYEQNKAISLAFTNGIIEDASNNRIWTYGDNGILFSPSDKIHFQKVNELVPALDHNVGRTNAAVLDDENVLWSTISDNGLLKIDIDGNEYEYFSFNREQKQNDPSWNTITCMSEDPSDPNILWLASIAGIIRFNKKTNQYKGFRTPVITNISHFVFGQIHVGFNAVYLGGGTPGFFAIDKNSEQFIQPLKAQFPNTHQSIQDFYVVDSVLWITSKDGVVQYNIESKTIKEICKNKGDSINGIALIDSKGTVWYNYEKGLIKYGRNNISQTYIDLTDFIEEQSIWDVHNIFQTNQFIYIANYDRLDLIRVNLSNYFVDKINIVPTSAVDPTEYAIRDAIILDDGNSLILTQQKILVFDPTTEKITEFQFQMPNLSARSIVQDQNQNLWIGTFNGSIFKIDIEDKKATDYTNKLNEIDPNNTNWVRELFIDSKNRLWISRRPSVYVFDLNDLSINYYRPNQNQILNNNSNVGSFYEDGDGLMWAAKYSNGIEAFDMDKLPYNPLFQIKGFYSDIFSFNDSLLWTAGKGFGILNKNTHKNKLFEIDESNEPISAIGPIYETEDQELMVVCKNGILIIHNQQHKLDLPLPLAYIRSIESKGNLLFESNSVSNRQMKLDSDIDHLKVSMSSVGYQLQQKVSYQYNLQNNWIDNGESEEINISNLAPGRYTLKIKACNSFGICQDSPTEYIFVIPPPWYKSWWAFILYSLVIITPLILIYRFNAKRKIAVAEKNKAIEIDALKSKMYANISHEFRTPLTVILGMVNVLKTSTDQNKESNNKSLNMIQRSGENLLVMVNEMLDLAKAESGTMPLTMIQSDIIPFTKYLSESFQSLAQNKGISLTVYSEIDQLEMDFDVNKLGAIISNLLSNAIKFSSEGDKVIVHLNRSQTNGKDFLILKIKDTGMGLSEEEMNHVFDRFYQVQTVHTKQGTGLGLSLVKEYVELMNGTIEVESVAEKGSNFMISLPVTNDAIQEADVQMTAGPSFVVQETSHKFDTHLEEGQSELPLVLIIEDNEDVAHYLKTCLKGKFKTLHAQNGNLGVKMALQNIPDVVISDVMMPEKDGFEVCKELKTNELTEHIPIILLTAKATDVDRIVGLSHGADAYLSKPFNEVELFTRLDQLIALRQKFLNKINSGEVGKILKKRLENPETKFLQKAIKIIHSNITDHSFGPTLLAHKLQISESQVYRKLKAITGKSTALFIRSIRLIKGKEMMQSTDKTISEISYEIGFNDPSWFSRAFKEEFGFSPNTMRK